MNDLLKAIERYIVILTPYINIVLFVVLILLLYSDSFTRSIISEFSIPLSMLAISIVGGTINSIVYLYFDNRLASKEAREIFEKWDRHPIAEIIFVLERYISTSSGVLKVHLTKLLKTYENEIQKEETNKNYELKISNMKNELRKLRSSEAGFRAFGEDAIMADIVSLEPHQCYDDIVIILQGSIYKNEEIQASIDIKYSAGKFNGEIKMGESKSFGINNMTFQIMVNSIHKAHDYEMATVKYLLYSGK